jgi:hypothetical protein
MTAELGSLVIPHGYAPDAGGVGRRSSERLAGAVIGSIAGLGAVQGLDERLHLLAVISLVVDVMPGAPPHTTRVCARMH